MYSHRDLKPTELGGVSRNLIKGALYDSFGKGVSKADNLPISQLTQVTEVDLSHNCLITLESIEQFAWAISINLSHNKIADQNQLKRLTLLPALQSVKIAGNPFLKQKLARETVVLLAALETDLEELQFLELNQIVEQLTRLWLASYFQQKLFLHQQLIRKMRTPKTTLSHGYARIKKHITCVVPKRKIKEWILKRIDPMEQFEPQLSKTLKQLKRDLIETEKRVYQFEKRIQSVSPEKDSRRSPQTRRDAREVKQSYSGEYNLVTPSTNQLTHRKQLSPKKQFPFIIIDDKSFEQNYLKNLTRINPVFHLLYSPTQSLKSKEKDILLNSMCLVLKEKMKLLNRYEHYKEQCSQLQRNNKALEQEIRDQRHKIQLRRSESESEHQALQSLKLQNWALSEKNSLLETENSGLKEENQHNRRLLADNTIYLEAYQRIVSKEDSFCDHIAINKSLRLKKEALVLFQRRAHLFSRVRHFREAIMAKDSKTLLKDTFLSIKFETWVNKRASRFSELLRDRRVKQALLQLRNQNRHLIQRQKVLRRVRIKGWLVAGYQQFNFLKESHERKNILLNAANSHLQKRLLSKYYFHLKELRNNKKQMERNQAVVTMGNRSLLRSFWYFWHEYINQINLKETNLCRQVGYRFKMQGLVSFQSYCLTARHYRTCSIILASFLMRYRLRKTFYNFARTINWSLNSRRMKKLKIQRRKQAKYMNYFIRTMQEVCLKKRILQMGVQDKRNRQEIKQLQQQHRLQIGDIRKKRLSQLVEKSFQFFRNKILLRGRSQILLEQYLEQNQMKLIFRTLWSLLNSQRSLKLKQNNLAVFQVTRSLSAYAKHRFFRALSRKRFMAIRLRHFFFRKAMETMTSHFFYWRYVSQRKKIYLLKHKVLELRPQIDYISEQQRLSIEVVETTKQQLAVKNQLIADYVRQIGQMKILMETKDIKYDNLKKVYYEMNDSTPSPKTFLTEASHQDYQRYVVSPFSEETRSNRKKQYNYSRQKDDYPDDAPTFRRF